MSTFESWANEIDQEDKQELEQTAPVMKRKRGRPSREEIKKKKMIGNTKSDFSIDSSEELEALEKQMKTKIENKSDFLDTLTSENDSMEEVEDVGEETEEEEEDFDGFDEEKEWEEEEEKEEEEEEEEESSLEAKLKQERGWRKRLSRELREMKEMLRGFQSRAELHETVKEEKQEFGDRPDEETDPWGALQWDLKTMRAELRAIKESKVKEEEGTKEAKMQQALLGEVQRQAKAYQTKNPHFADAMSFLSAHREKELRAAGATPAEIERTIVGDIMYWGQKALLEGDNVGRILWNIAVARGFKKGMKTGMEPITGSGNGSGQKSVSRIAKKPTRMAMADPIDSMSDKDFDQYFNKLKKQSRRI